MKLTEQQERAVRQVVADCAQVVMHDLIDKLGKASDLHGMIIEARRIGVVEGFYYENENDIVCLKFKKQIAGEIMKRGLFDVDAHIHGDDQGTPGIGALVDRYVSRETAREASEALTRALTDALAETDESDAGEPGIA